MPRSSQSRVLWENGVLRIWVHAPPTGGQANQAACRLVAEALRVPTGAVSVAKGGAARDKLIDIADLSDEVLSKLLEAMS